MKRAKDKLIASLLTSAMLLTMCFSLDFVARAESADRNGDEVVDAGDTAVPATGDEATADGGEVANNDTGVRENAEHAEETPVDVTKVPVKFKAKNQKGAYLGTFYATVKNLATNEEIEVADVRELAAGSYEMINVRSTGYKSTNHKFDITEEQVKKQEEVIVEVTLEEAEAKTDKIKVRFSFYNTGNQGLEKAELKGLKVTIYDSEKNEYTVDDEFDRTQVYSYLVKTDEYEDTTGGFNLYTLDNEEIKEVHVHLKPKDTTSPPAASVLKDLPVFFVGENKTLTLSTNDAGSGIAESTWSDLPNGITATSIYTKEFVAYGGTQYPRGVDVTFGGAAAPGNQEDNIVKVYMQDGAGNGAYYHYLLKIIDRRDLRSFLEKEAGAIYGTNKYKKADPELKKNYDTAVQDALKVVNNTNSTTATQNAVDEALKTLLAAKESLNGKDDSEVYTPIDAELKVKTGEIIDIKKTIKNFDDLPEGTELSFKDEENTPSTENESDRNYIVIVKYPDKSTEEVSVTIKVVKPDNEKYPVTPKENLTVEKDSELKPEDVINGKDSFPENTSVEWKDESSKPDTSSEGEKNFTVVITYPDGTSTEVSGKVTVTAKDKDKYQPEVKENFEVETGMELNPKDLIENYDDLPKGTEVNWKDENSKPDTSSEGEKKVTIIVKYPDGSEEEVSGKVTVTAKDKDKYQPEVKENFEVETGTELDPKDLIENYDDLPKGTEVNWKDENSKPDTSSEGGKEVTIIVKYPDGSEEEVSGKVTIIKPDKGDNGGDKEKLKSSIPTDYPVQDTKPIANVEDIEKFENNSTNESTINSTSGSDTKITPNKSQPDGKGDSGSKKSGSGNKKGAGQPVAKTGETMNLPVIIILGLMASYILSIRLRKEE